MKFLSAVAFAIVFLGTAAFVNGQASDSRYMAFCSDGDGSLSEWVSVRDEAYIAARDHERSHRGHRWEVMVQQGKAALQPASCALVGDDPEKPNAVRVVNTCGACRTFKVTRRNADGTVKSREFKVKAGSQRRFLKKAGAEIVVEGESDCPGS